MVPDEFHRAPLRLFPPLNQEPAYIGPSGHTTRPQMDAAPTNHPPRNEQIPKQTNRINQETPNSTMKRNHNAVYRLGSVTALALIAAFTARADYPSTVLSQSPPIYYQLNETIRPRPKLWPPTSVRWAPARMEVLWPCRPLMLPARSPAVFPWVWMAFRNMWTRLGWRDSIPARSPLRCGPNPP